MSSFEQLPENTKPVQENEEGYPGMEREELLAEIDKGVCMDQIPIDEALAELLALRNIFLEEVPSENEDNIPSKIEDFFGLLNSIDIAVDRKIIPVEEEIALFKRIRSLKKRLAEEEIEQ